VHAVRGVLRQLGKKRRVAEGCAVGICAHRQPYPGKVAHRLEQPIARDAIDRLGQNQRVVDQVPEQI
jgi:hypothetical protein